MHRENQETRTGPLRNGNPRGNPNLAPRCGAKTRTGCPCQSPAMTNGRCRMHGGASTGPRTPEGRARISAANTTHGFYTAEGQAARRRTDAFIAETRALLASLHQAATPAQTPASRRSSPPQAAPTQQDAPCTPPPHTP
jgi:hypothetical protein